jgi:hypothetical protein
MVKIQVPVGTGQAVMHCEISDETFGTQDLCGEVLSSILTAHYGYPIKVTVETDQDFCYEC